MKQSISRNLILLFFGLAIITFSNSCTKEEEDACLKSETTQKVTNVKVFLTIENQSGVPVEEEEVSVTISHFACGSDITLSEDAVASQEFTGTTNEFGLFESDNVNFVLTNTQDRVVAFAIAPNLDFFQQNYHREIKYYADLQGTGQDEIYLTIIQKNQQ